ncbi:hypothetical protein ACJX0J_007509, partial [Zea mays]
VGLSLVQENRMLDRATRAMLAAAERAKNQLIFTKKPYGSGKSRSDIKLGCKKLRSIITGYLIYMRIYGVIHNLYANLCVILYPHSWYLDRFTRIYMELLKTLSQEAVQIAGKCEDKLHTLI